MDKFELSPNEREGIVKSFADTVSALMVDGPEYITALRAIATHLRNDHDYNEPDAIEVTSLISSDALRFVADVSHKAALEAANDKRKAG